MKKSKGGYNMKYAYEKSISELGTVIFDFGETLNALTDFLITDVSDEKRYLEIVEDVKKNDNVQELTGNATTIIFKRGTVHLKNQYTESECEIEIDEFAEIIKEYISEVRKQKNQN